MSPDKKVLLISDDLVFSDKVIKLLDPKIYETKTVPLSENSAKEAETFKPDLTIVDILSNSINPLSLIEKIKSNPFTQNLKLIAVSQSRKIENIVGPVPRVKGCLSKPIDFDELKKLISSVLGENKGKILVTDDDQEFTDLIKMFLESNGFRPIVVNNPLRAVEKIKNEKPDLILMDIMMPGKDGFAIMNELQEENKTASIPIIVLTGLKFEKFQEKGLLTGLPEIVSKEIPGDFLLNVIEKELAVNETEENVSGPIKPKVLLADDQTELLLLIKETIENAGFEVHIASDGKEAMEKVYETNPDIIVLDYNMPIKDGLQVAEDLKQNPLFAHIPIVIVTAYGEKQAKLRGLSMGIDDYLIKPVDTDELIARLRMILKRNKQVLDTNPLSKLPGNPSIQARVERVIQTGRKFAVLYLDLNNFKAYNDIYGFEAGDRVIKTTSNILVKISMPGESSENFIGHIGGDDFIIVTDFEKAEDLAKKVINAFNEISPSFYNKEDRERGYIVSTDRQGNIKKFFFLSISIGIVHNTLRPINSYAQVSNIGSELKKAAKNSSSSAYVIDKRKD